MTGFYRGLAYLLAALVVVQAATHAWMSAGVNKYIQDGGVIDKAFMEAQGGPPPFPEIAGAIIHGLNGTFLIPAVALALTLVGLGAKFPRAGAYGAVAILLVAVQIGLGMTAMNTPLLGLLHGLNALVIFTVALVAAQAAGRARQGVGAPRTTVHAAG